MDPIELRREAEFCLRLMQLWTDRSLSHRLSFLAARYHETALRAELDLPLVGTGNPENNGSSTPRPGRH
jgi:hypothetical protein